MKRNSAHLQSGNERFDGSKRRRISQQQTTDLTANLPAEVLCEIFSKITSLPDKFRLAAVNGKFRKCVFREMKKPRPFEINFVTRLLCRRRLLDLSKWLTAIDVLAKEACFNRITIQNFDHSSANGLYSEIFDVLLFNVACLSQVTEIHVEAFGFDASVFHEDGAAGLEAVIHNCEKLSILKLQFMHVPFRNPDQNPHDPVLDLASALKDKPITELVLELGQCTEQEVVDILRAPKLNTLRKLNIAFDNSEVDVIVLVRDLCHTAAQSLEVVKFVGISANQPLTELFACFPQLPALHFIDIAGTGLVDFELFKASVKLLLNNNRSRTTPLVVKYSDSGLDIMPCCWMLWRVTEIKQELPQAIYGYDVELKKMRLSLGNVAIGLHNFEVACVAADCQQCPRSYPLVIKSLAERASNEARWHQHVGNLWLSRCKIDHVLHDLYGCSTNRGWKAVQIMEYKALNRATVTFRRRNGIQFTLAVDTSRCFDSSCARCLHVE